MFSKINIYKLKSKPVQARKNNVQLLVTAVLCLSCMLSSCLKEVTNEPRRAKGYISFLQLAAKSPSVELYFNNEKGSGAFTPGMVTERYNQINPGFYSINFKKAGSDSMVASIPSAFYDSLNFYTVLLYSTPGGSVDAELIHDNYSTVTDGNKIYYRFFNMCPAFDNVDLYFNAGKKESGRTYADNVLNSPSFNEFRPIESDSYTIYVKTAGTDSVIAQASVTLNGGSAYTIYLKGLPGGTGTNALGVGILLSTLN